MSYNGSRHQRELVFQFFMRFI